jgi:hypothetical protein
MLNQKHKKEERKSLFASEIPMKKSYVLTEVFLVEQNCELLNVPSEKKIVCQSQ